MLIAIKTLSWTAVAVLFGAGLRRYLLAPERPVLAPALLLAVATVPLAGALELWHTVGQVRTPVTAELWWRYASTTAHGHAVLWRSVACSLGAVCIGFLARRWWPAAALLGVWLCYGFSRLSHAAAIGGWVPLGYDLVHLVGAAVWAGGVWIVAFTRWDVPEVERLSRLAAWTVTALAITGVLSALTHAADPARFLGSGYALALLVKLVAVALVLSIAAVNRFSLVPRARSGDRQWLGISLYAESALLLGVLVATGWLSTTPVPHGDGVAPGAIENLRRLVDHLVR